LFTKGRFFYRDIIDPDNYFLTTFSNRPTSVCALRAVFSANQQWGHDRIRSDDRISLVAGGVRVGRPAVLAAYGQYFAAPLALK
jgi:hypothetical protein